MMPPAFGFSVGDFIAAIGLCTKVAKALKESGGVKAEYQQVIIEIEGLQVALARLAALEPTESNVDHVNAIRRMALACSFPLQDFLTKLNKYEATMSPFSTVTSFRSAGKKVQYAVFVSEEVKTIRAMISGKVISINLLLATHASETLSRTEGQLSIVQKSIFARLEEGKDDMNSIRQEIGRMRAAATTSHEQLRQERAESTHRLTEQFNQINQDTARAERDISTLTMGVTSISTSVTSLYGLGAQVLAILRSFPTELRTILQTMLRTNTQMYAVLLELHRKIGAHPTLALDSNIRIEDALGEVRSLPFEWFRHWEPFEGLLQAEFKNRLGAERVKRGDFRLVHSKRPNISYDKNNWSQTITSGADILMLMLITDLACQESICPRQSCNGRTALKANRQVMLTCSKCGLRFMPQRMLPDSADANMLEQLQIEEDARLFGLRNESHSQNLRSLHLGQSTAPKAIDEWAEDIEFSEGGDPSTHQNTTPWASVEISSKFKASSNTAHDQSEPPIYSWLAGTEPPKDPDSVLKWREEEEIRLAERQKQNAEDLEVFRNVEIIIPLDPDVPMSDARDSADPSYLGTDKSTTGAYVLYRNIVDQYPKLRDPLAWRFANMNWKRMEIFRREQRANPASVSLPGENLDGPIGTPSGGLKVQKKVDIAPNNPPAYPDFPGVSNPWRRKTCSLPPPTRPSPKQESDSAYSLKCHLCSQIIRIRYKRDWSNHVMDDLLPYSCPFVDCLTGDDTYARRRELSAHIKVYHRHESLRLCPFCGKEVESSLVKHLGHHMEEIAFGALSTAYEEWSYDDSNSEGSVLSASSGSALSAEGEGQLKHHCTTYWCSLSFAKSSHLKKHIYKHNHEGDFKTYCSRRFPDLATIQKKIQPDNANEKSMLLLRSLVSHPQCQSGRRNNFSDAVDHSRGMVSLSQADINPRNIYGPISGASHSMDVDDVPPSPTGTDNYWTRSSHPSSSASSVNSQLRYSVSDCEDLSTTLSTSSALEHRTPSAPGSLIEKSTFNVSSSSGRKNRCKICDKCFSGRYSLQAHMYLHTGEKSFACDVEGCDQRFIFDTGLRRHRSKEHKGTASDNPSLSDC